MIRRSSFEDAIDFSSQVFKIKRKYVVKTAFIVDHEFLSALSLDNETIVNNYAEMKEIKEKTRKSSRKLIALNQEFKKVDYLLPMFLGLHKIPQPHP